MLELVSERNIVKDISESEELFPLQSLAEDTAAWCPGETLGNLEKPAEQVTRMQSWRRGWES